MKKLLIGVYLLASSNLICARIDPFTSIEEAIENTDVQKVAMLLSKINKRLEKEGVAVDEKKKRFAPLFKQASQKAEQIKGSIRIAANKKDAARFVGGLFLLQSFYVVPTLALTLMNEPTNEKDSDTNSVRLGGSSLAVLLFSILGGKLVWDGYFCKSQNEILHNALKIGSLIESGGDTDSSK